MFLSLSSSSQEDRVTSSFFFECRVLVTQGHVLSNANQRERVRTVLILVTPLLRDISVNDGRNVTCARQVCSELCIMSSHYVRLVLCYVVRRAARNIVATNGLISCDRCRLLTFERRAIRLTRVQRVDLPICCVIFVRDLREGVERSANCLPLVLVARSSITVLRRLRRRVIEFRAMSPRVLTVISVTKSDRPVDGHRLSNVRNEFRHVATSNTNGA